MRFPRLITFLVLAAALGVVAVADGARTLDPNPANDPALIKQKIDPVRYDGAGGRCAKRDPRGTRQLTKWLRKYTIRKAYVGTIRCDGGVHSTGRAIDIMLDARVGKEGRKAKRVIRTWMADDRRGRDNALARRMGVQLIIYDCKWWQAGDRRMSPYSACGGGNKKNADPTQGHIDHIHIELTEPAAKLRTTFWRTTLDGQPDSGDKGGGVSPSSSRRSAPIDHSDDGPFAGEHPGGQPAIP